MTPSRSVPAFFLQNMVIFAYFLNSLHNSTTTVFALPKFTIPDDKKLVVEMYEKQGGRHQIFEVDNEDLVRAETINELQVR